MGQARSKVHLGMSTQWRKTVVRLDRKVAGSNTYIAASRESRISEERTHFYKNCLLGTAIWAASMHINLLEQEK